MTDGIIRGSGNSRYLRTVANARTLYPTYSDFITALIQGTFPIDLNGINSSGWSTVGMKLNKANLLTDSLCSALGLPTSSTPNQAMEKLRQLIATAQAGVDNGVKISIVSYTGTNTYGESNPCSITFHFAPKIFAYMGQIQTSNKMIYRSIGNFVPADLLDTTYKSGVGFSAQSSYKGKKSENGKTMYWYSSESASNQFNSSSFDHWFLGIG